MHREPEQKMEKESIYRGNCRIEDDEEGQNMINWCYIVYQRKQIREIKSQNKKSKKVRNSKQAVFKFF